MKNSKYLLYGLPIGYYVGLLYHSIYKGMSEDTSIICVGILFVVLLLTSIYSKLNERKEK